MPKNSQSISQTVTYPIFKLLFDKWLEQLPNHIENEWLFNEVNFS